MGISAYAWASFGGLPLTGDEAHHRLLHACDGNALRNFSKFGNQRRREGKTERETKRTNQVQVAAPSRRPRRRAVQRRRERRSASWSCKGAHRSWILAGGEGLGFGSGGEGEGAAIVEGAAASWRAAASLRRRRIGNVLCDWKWLRL